MASAVITNLSAFQGEDTLCDCTIYDENGNPEDITNWAINFSVYVYRDSSSVFFTKYVGNGITLTDPANGQLQIAIASADTVNMFPDQYSYAIQRTDSGAEFVPTIGLFSLLAPRSPIASIPVPPGGGLTGTFGSSF